MCIACSPGGSPLRLYSILIPWPDFVIFAVPTLFPSASWISTVLLAAARHNAAARLPIPTTHVILLRKFMAPLYHTYSANVTPSGAFAVQKSPPGVQRVSYLTAG